MGPYTLYCFAQSGNAYKAALMLNLSGADWAPRFVDYFNGETRTPAYRAVNVMGEVPVLEGDGQRLTQSGVILDYLSGRLGQFGQFGPESEEERRDILRWTLFDNHKLTSYTATYRFMRCFGKDPDAAVLAFLRTRSEGAWAVLEAHLDGRDFVAAARPTTADLSLCGYLFWPEEIGINWLATHPRIAMWLDRIRSLPGWRHPYALLPGHPLPARSG